MEIQNIIPYIWCDKKHNLKDTKPVTMSNTIKNSYTPLMKRRVIEMYFEEGTLNKSFIAREILKEFSSELPSAKVDSIRKNLVCATIDEHSFQLTNAKDTAQHTALVKECDNVGIPVQDVNYYWYKGEHFSINAKPEKIDYHKLKNELIEEMKEYAPSYPTIVREIDNSEHYCLVIDPADIHIGKLSQGLLNNTEYNSKIAVDRVFEGVRGILDKSAGYKIDQIIFVAGNDILHIDSPTRKTTKGTPQDTDGMWYSNYQIAKKLYIDILEILLTVADVHVMFCPSNHDWTNGYFLCDAVETWFTNNANITFDSDIRHRKYMRYGNSLIGTTHGDGAKPDKLPLLMANEAKEDWALCKHYYVYTHHVHHKNSKDYGPVNVESLRSPSGTDMWHHISGYQGQPKAVEAFIHSKTHGQVGRFTHIF